ncbi:hypothetical protein EJ03DRAFT_88027 [Teratosphaeria nubilosa]|uniref:Uncharacterized protein n=1 Tax=Teratosphaeria nubilosa TaxID=161662 RepID=A0A6G1LAU6_9PEZI|nr:hypothetical protein EJ03DRAFT_88027 [Teratosphaeria nubilosa]
MYVGLQSTEYMSMSRFCSALQQRPCGPRHLNQGWRMLFVECGTFRRAKLQQWGHEVVRSLRMWNARHLIVPTRDSSYILSGRLFLVLFLTVLAANQDSLCSASDWESVCTTSLL